jgi:hypothetical protein
MCRTIYRFGLPNVIVSGDFDAISSGTNFVFNIDHVGKLVNGTIHTSAATVEIERRLGDTARGLARPVLHIDHVVQFVSSTKSTFSNIFIVKIRLFVAPLDFTSLVLDVNHIH